MRGIAYGWMGSVAVAAALAACAPGSSLETDGAGGAAAGGGSGSTTSDVITSGSGGGGGDTIGGQGGSGGLPNPDDACGLVTEEGDRAPLNLYLVVDKSSTMAGGKWTAATKGLSAFVADPGSTGVSVGLKFFPREADSTPVCSQDAYKIPDVPFGELPANADAITQALTAAVPNGFSTPTYPALGGALLKGIEFQKNNPGNTSAVLLVTDGAPQGPAPLCGGVNPEDADAIADLARAAHEQFSVLTYVVGLPGVDQTFANKVAAAGGTDNAIIIGTSNVEAAFADALGEVRGDALPCSYAIPSQVGSQFDYNQVNVLFTPTGGETTKIKRDATCAGAGWAYDDPTNPKEIVLCPATCDTVKSDGTAKVEVLLGCATIIK